MNPWYMILKKNLNNKLWRRNDRNKLKRKTKKFKHPYISYVVVYETLIYDIILFKIHTKWTYLFLMKPWHITHHSHTVCSSYLSNQRGQFQFKVQNIYSMKCCMKKHLTYFKWYEMCTDVSNLHNDKL